MRKIIHLDMDCFYAAVELRERPELDGRPVAVGGGARRGVVTTCNYAARAFGVRSAMPGFQARQLCPQIIFLPVRSELYRAESQKIRRLLLEVTPLVEPVSLDEAYLDVTGLDRYAWDIAGDIRRRILAETGLTASAGVAPNKMLAKIASDWRKPDGQFAITPDQIDAFLVNLPIRKLWGVGPKSAQKFQVEGIHTCGDLQRIPLAELVKRHGKWGEDLHNLCRGHDNRAVEPNRPRKSLSNEITFHENLDQPARLAAELKSLVAALEKDWRAGSPERVIRKIFIKVKFADFTRCSRECLSPAPSLEMFAPLLRSALASAPGKPVRLLGTGVRFADLDERQVALPLGFD